MKNYSLDPRDSVNILVTQWRIGNTKCLPRNELPVTADSRPVDLQEQSRTEIVLHLHYYSFSWHCIHIQLFTSLVTKQGIITMDELCVKI